MKQKTSGLHVGKYRKQPDFKTNLAATILPAALIFCALAGLLTTVTGLTAILSLFASGLIFLTLFTLAKHFRKEAILLPAALVILIVIVIFARATLLNGFGALWNETRNLWAAEQGVLLPLAQTDGSGRWLASVLCSLLLAVVALLLSKAPTLASVLLICCTVAAGLVHITPWLILSAGISLLLLAWQKNTVSAVNFLLLGAVVLGIVALVLQAGTMQNLSQTAKDALHHWRYEKADKVLPEGDLTKPVPTTDGTEAILSVTSDKTDTLYLRGFVGDTYENGTWSALDAETAAAEKDLFYWLHENGFYPQSQFALSAIQTAKYETETIQISNLSACSLYRYEPFSVLPTSAGTAENRLAPSAVKTSGWNGEREYSYTVIAYTSTILPQILDALQQGEPSSSYLQTESAYRDFVDSYALAVPQEFVDEMGALLEETNQDLNFSGALTKEEAQLCALSFLETCFGGDTSLPLDSTAKGTTYQYATVAALALRYYGIPARYVEGFTVRTTENETASVTAENAGAWVEVYQDGVGWLPLALTPGLESLAPEQTESGIKPVGSGEGEGSGPRITEGQEPEQQDADQSEDSDNTPDGGQRTGLLAKPAFWILLIAGILLLFVLFILIRHHIILKNRQKTFDDPDNSESISSLFSDAAKLLSALGFDRRGGSMLALYDPISGQFGEETANTFRTMVFLNEKALFSSKTPDDPEREAMQDFHKTVLNLLKTNTKWPKRLRLKWLNCLY
mgnify:CR=1 FL=1